MPREIQLTPDYVSMFRMFTEEALNQGTARGLFADLGAHAARSTITEARAIRAAALRDAQRFVSALNIAAQCMTDRAAVERFREVLAEIATHIDDTATRLEREADDALPDDDDNDAAIVDEIGGF